MKDSTIKNYARQSSAIQDISDVTFQEEGMITCCGLQKYKALCVVDFRGKVKEFFVSTWSEEKEFAKKELQTLKNKMAFEILKYQFKIK